MSKLYAVLISPDNPKSLNDFIEAQCNSSLLRFVGIAGLIGQQVRSKYDSEPEALFICSFMQALTS